MPENFVVGIHESRLFHTPEIVYAQISVQSPQMGQDFKITDYAHYNNDFDKQEAFGWIEELLADFNAPS